MPGPLAGIKVLDMTSVLLGPYATLHLADMGADVIKIESPAGDVMRYAGPYKSYGMSPIFLNVNRNKRSLVLDLKGERGRDVMHRLIGTADVLVHNIRPRAAAALGMAYHDVREINPKLVYCAAHGFGQDGPYANKAAYDDVVQGAAGIAAMQGVLTGTPQYVATAMCDKTAGIMVAMAISAALFERHTSGEGQEVEVPMFEVVVANMMAEHLYGHTFVPDLGPAVYPRQTSPYRRPYRTSDGYISVMVYNDKQWREFFKLIGQPQLIEDDRFNSINARTENISLAYQMVEQQLSAKTTADWLEIFERVSIPASKVNSIEDLLSDPHLNEVEMFTTQAHPTEGPVRVVRSPMRFSRTPAEIRNLAPVLGADAAAVLSDAGFTESEISELIKARVVGAAMRKPDNAAQHQ